MGLFKSKKTEEKEEISVKKKSIAKDDKKASMKDLYKDTKQTSTSAKTTVKFAGKKEMAYRVLLKPLITEKAASLSSENKYVFAVAKSSNKIEITKAIFEVYGVKPKSVNIVIVKGKKVRHGRIIGKRKDWKKAIVTLPKGKTINIYEGV